MLALQQTSRYGSREVLGLEGDPNLAFGKRFAAHGFIVLAPDEFLAGENYDSRRDWNTTDFYRQNPEWSAMGRMLADHEHALAAIQSLGYRPRCIAVVGHSLGGHNALLLAALDHKVDVAVSNAGFERISTDDDALRWARQSWFVYMPKLRPYLSKKPPRAVPWDFDDVLRAIEPRSVMISQGLRDPVWTHVASVGEIANTIADEYRHAHIADHFKVVLFNGVHEFPPATKEAAVRFVEQRCAALHEQSAGTSSGNASLAAARTEPGQEHREPSSSPAVHGAGGGQIDEKDEKNVTTEAENPSPAQRTTQSAAEQKKYMEEHSLTAEAWAGASLRLVFDAEACRDMKMGTLACGVPYIARYDAWSNTWTVSGLQRGSNQQFTASDNTAEAKPGAISVWGRWHTFDNGGNLYFKREKVGRIGLDK